MWKKTAIILIVLSVAMNLAFIGVWGVHAAGGKYRGRRPGADSKERGKFQYSFYRNLSVTEEQWEQIEPGLVEFQKASQAVRDEMNRKRREMINLIAAPETDMQAIEAKQEEILAGQRRMQELVIRHLLSEKEILTPEQRKAFFRMFRECSGCAGRGPMRNIRR